MVNATLKPLNKFLHPQGTVLIRASFEEGSSGYHAAVGPMVLENSFIVFFHSSSLLLERVLTQGSLLVEIDFCEEKSYLGELKLHESFKAPVGACALVVKLYDEKKATKPSIRLCPMT